MFKDRAILTLSITQTLIWAGLFYLFPASLLLWEVDLGWSRADLAFGITLAILGSALCAPLAGRFIDRNHGATLMGLAPVLGGLALIALSQITMLWQFYALWLFIGVMQSGSLYEPCFALITHARGDNAKSGIVFVTLVAGFAGTIAFPTVHFLSEAIGWRWATALIGLAIAVLVAPMQWRAASSLQRDRVPPQPRPATEVKARSFLRRPVFWLLGVGLATLAFVHGTTISHLLPLLNERGVSPEFAVFIAAMIGPMQVVGRVVMVASQRFFDNRHFLLFTYLSMGGAITLLLVSGDTHALIVVFVLFYGSAWGMTSILRPVIAREFLGQENFGAKSGSLALIFLAASASSAYLGALVWQAYGYNILLSGLVALTTIGATLYLLANKAARSSAVQQ